MTNRSFFSRFSRHFTALGLASALFGYCGPAYAQAAPSPYTSATRYDPVGRVTGTIAPDPDGSGLLHYAAIRNSYDAAGRLSSVESGELSSWQSEGVAPALWTGFSVFRIVTMSYDAMSRKTREVDAAIVNQSAVPQAVTDYSYTNNRLDCSAVRMNTAAFGSLPTSACTAGPQGAAGPDRITHNIYDALSRVTKVQKAYGTFLQQDYATYTYGTDGLRTSVTDANGNVATMGYDGFDRQNQWRFPSPSVLGQTSTTDYEGYGYDANGNRTSLRKRDGRTLTYAFDALNRVTSKVVPDNCAPIQVGTCTPTSATRDVYYAYDLLGHQTAARFDGATGADAALNSYDGYGNLSSSTISMGGFTKTLTNQYDADGNRTQLTHPDGVYFTTGYDGLDRVNSASWTAGTGTTSFLGIGYDAAERRSSITRASSSTSYGYDGISRLNSMSQLFAGGSGNVNLGFTYNAGSQMLSESRDNDAFAFNGLVAVNRPYAINGLNQYTAAGPAAFTYDANGNLVSDGTNSFVYDAENRLVSSSSGTSLTYDPMGRLWQTVKGSANTRFLYDGDKLAAEYDGSGAMTSRYMFAGEDEPILADQGGALACGTGTRFLHTDHQGSIVAAADCSGNRTKVLSYDEYGIPGTANGNDRFQYTGQAWIPELGMYYYKARFYSPTLGRFMQTDPIGYKDQVNLYAYVANDPIDGRDPTGLEGDDSVGSRVAQFAWGTAEVIVGAAGTVLGAAGDIGSGGLTLATGGLAGPVTVPAAVVSTAVVVGSVALAADGARNMTSAMTSSNGDRSGGGRNAQKSNPDRVSSAQQRVDQAKQKLQDLKSQPNKTPADKAQMNKLDKQIKTDQMRMRDSENHSMKDKR